MRDNILPHVGRERRQAPPKVTIASFEKNKLICDRTWSRPNTAAMASRGANQMAIQTATVRNVCEAGTRVALLINSSPLRSQRSEDCCA